jgi:ribosome recycling factor
MQYYDEQGELRFTKDTRKARICNAFNLLKSSGYPMHPEAAGRLRELLAPNPTDETRQEAIDRARTALRRAGIDLELEAVLRAVGGEWEMLIEETEDA